MRIRRQARGSAAVSIPSLKSRRRIKGGGLAPRYYSKQMASAVDVVSPPIPRENRNTSARPRPLGFPASLRINETHVPRSDRNCGDSRGSFATADNPGNTRSPVVHAFPVNLVPALHITNPAYRRGREGGGRGGRRESLFTSGRVKTLFSIFDGARNAVARLF